MKIVCSKENLAEGINIVSKAVSGKTTLPVLEGILLECGEAFKLTGNDLEIGIECYVEADIMEQGSVVINARMLNDIIRRLPDSEVSLEVRQDNLVIIECENSHFEIKGLPSEGFPALPVIEKENAFKISQKIVKEMIRQTIFAVGTDENRPILTGSLMECKEGELVFVSIDGFRVALRRNMIKDEGVELRVVIPGKTLNEISKILQSTDEIMTIYSTYNQILFDTGNCKIVSRLLEGNYLNYKSILPAEHETKIRVNAKDMLSSIERAALVITSEERRYPVRFSLSDDKLVITSSTDIGAVREELRVEIEGKDLDISFNHRYFTDALKVVDDTEIEVFFTSAVGPCTIRPVEGNDYAYMVLPVRK